MITDCPNCSWIIKTDARCGESVLCPFCGEDFEICFSPFEQLRRFMVTHYPPVEYGPFRDYGYPRKNYTGWIIHRLRENNREDVIRLMADFYPNEASEKVTTLWNFDFSPYLNVDPGTLEEIRALWLRVRLACHARPESQDMAVLLQLAMWTKKIEITPYWKEKALEFFEDKNKDSILENDDNIEIISVQDLSIKPPQNNPIFNWAIQTPIAIRERLWSALRMCNFSCNGNMTTPNSYQFRLDQSQEYRWGADCGYATKYLLESNIFCDPRPETYEKLFSKQEFFIFMKERGLPTVPNYTRKYMLNLLRNGPEGALWFEQKIKEHKIVRLHPSLSDYCTEVRQCIWNGYRLFEAIGMIPVPEV